MIEFQIAQIAQSVKAEIVIPSCLEHLQTFEEVFAGVQSWWG